MPEKGQSPGDWPRPHPASGAFATIGQRQEDVFQIGFLGAQIVDPGAGGAEFLDHLRDGLLAIAIGDGQRPVLADFDQGDSKERACSGQSWAKFLKFHDKICCINIFAEVAVYENLSIQLSSVAIRDFEFF